MNLEPTQTPGRSITVQSKARALRFLPRSPLGKFFLAQASYLPTFTAPFAHCGRSSKMPHGQYVLDNEDQRIYDLHLIPEEDYCDQPLIVERANHAEDRQ